MTFDPAAVRAGDRLPPLTFGPVSRQMLALYAGASGDHNPIHIDIDFARSAGLPDVFAHGMLSFGVLARVVTEWAGIGRLRRFGCRFTAITQVHDLLTMQGVVEERIDVDGREHARISLAAVAQDGRETLRGDALVALD